MRALFIALLTALSGLPSIASAAPIYLVGCEPLAASLCGKAQTQLLIDRRRAPPANTQECGSRLVYDLTLTLDDGSSYPPRYSLMLLTTDAEIPGLSYRVTPLLDPTSTPDAALAGHVSPDTGWTDFVFRVDAGHAATFLLSGINGWVSGTCSVLYA
jgi:hypothetical protein